MDVKIVVLINDVHAADNPIYGYIFCIIFVYSYKFKLNELMDQYRKKTFVLLERGNGLKPIWCCPRLGCILILHCWHLAKAELTMFFSFLVEEKPHSKRLGMS